MLSMSFSTYWCSLTMAMNSSRNMYQCDDMNNQQDATTFSFINLFNSALHVSGDKFAHPQDPF